MNHQPHTAPYPRDLHQGREQGVAAFFRYVYAWMALALMVSGVVGGLIASNAALLRAAANGGLILMLGTLGLGMFISARINTLSARAAGQLFLLYAALMGAMLAPPMLIYTSASVAKAFFISSATYAAAAGYGFSTRKELSGVGQFAFIGLVGALIALVVNAFLQSPMVDFVMSSAFVVVFTGLTAYDNQRLRSFYFQHGGSANLAIIGALIFYLNFINLFTWMVHLFGNRRD